MKLNETYKLPVFLKNLRKASETVRGAVDAMKREGVRDWCIVVYEAENMHTSSPYARVTLTHEAIPGKRWEGFMETSAYTDGARDAVAVVRAEYIVRALDDGYTRIEIEEI